jgi:hypothetical protein
LKYARALRNSRIPIPYIVEHPSHCSAQTYLGDIIIVDLYELFRRLPTPDIPATKRSNQLRPADSGPWPKIQDVQAILANKLDNQSLQWRNDVMKKR